MATNYAEPKATAAPQATPATTTTTSTTGATPARTATPATAPAARRTSLNTEGPYANPMSAGQRRTPDQIEDDIEATRARIEARIESLTAQTAPSRLLETTLGADLSLPVRDHQHALSSG